MSAWTYILGAIEISTFANTTAQASYITQTVIDHMPRITGSEGPASVHIVTPSNHDMSCSHDEFGRFSNLGNQKCWDRPLFEHTAHRLLLIEGKLRDRYFDQTIRETVNFLNRLSKQLFVSGISLAVCDRYSRSYVFSERDEWIYDNLLAWDDPGKWSARLLQDPFEEGSS